MPQTIENKTKIGIGLVIVVLLANGWLSYRAVRTLIANEQWVTHTHQVLENLTTVLSTLKDAETGERGYVISGDTAFLEPYHSAIQQIDPHIQNLKNLMADNPRQLERLPVLERLIATRIDALKQGIALQDAGKTQAARELIAAGAGKKAMDDIRQLIDTMAGEENRLLGERMEDSRASQRDTKATFIVANLVAMSFLLATGVVILQGVLDRKRTEDRIYAHRQLLEVTLSSIADAVISCDNDGSITFLNSIAESLTGWSAGEAAGQPLTKVFQIVNEESRLPVTNPALRAIREGAIVGLANHTVLLRRDGREIPIDDSGAPIKTAAGRILGAVVIFRDISERRRTEKERAQLLAAERAAREQAEAASRTKDEFLAILSHELKTPLTAVFGWIQLLKTRDMDRATKEKALEVIDRNLRIQNQLINDLLDVSQIITGKLTVHPERIDALDVIKATIETVRPSAEAKDIALTLEGQTDFTVLFVDPARLQQIVWNLLSNAVKFTPKGGVIIVRMRRFDDELVIDVIDSGEGISADFLPLVFDRFTQADASKTRYHGGLGLGLALARQLVELHGGRIQARSAGRGKGSTFTVSFPLPSAGKKIHAPEPVALGALHGSSLQGIRILLAEDEIDTRELIAHVLRGHGAFVAQAGSAAEALREFAMSEPDVVISDIGMPDADGYELMAMIQAKTVKPPPAIALTAYTSPADQERALKSGFRVHLRKPVEPSRLVSVVAALTQRAD
jgi:PAS domain S-box-containing protein